MEIQNYKAVNKGCLVAKFDVTIPQWGLTIRDLALFEKEGKRFLGMPGRPYEKDGAKKSYDHVVFDEASKKRFTATCLEKLEHLQQKASQPTYENVMPF